MGRRKKNLEYYAEKLTPLGKDVLAKIDPKYWDMMIEYNEKISEKDSSIAFFLVMYSKDVLEIGKRKGYKKIVKGFLKAANIDHSAASELAVNYKNVIEVAGIKGYQTIVDSVVKVSKKSKWIAGVIPDEDSVEILKAGVEAFNRWRRDYDEITVDLSNVTLKEEKLIGINLFEANLSCADLTDADLSWSDLRGADLSRIGASGTFFLGVDFHNANLYGANLGRAELSGSDFGGEKGFLVINPPYGKRMGDIQSSEKLLREIGNHLSTQFRGWQAIVIIPSRKMAKFLPAGLQSSSIFHGGMRLTLLIGLIK